MLTALHVRVVLEKAENSAAHKNMRVGAAILLDLFKGFVHPINTISAVNHGDSREGMRPQVFYDCGSVVGG
jgi:hypothetical protein